MDYVIECAYYDSFIEFDGKVDHQDFITVHNSREIADDMVQWLNDDQYRDCHFRIKQPANIA